MAQTPESPIFKLYKFLPLLEKVNLAAVFIGIVLQRLNFPGSTICFLVGLVGLAVTFFLMAYAPTQTGTDEEHQKGFSGLLAFSILPKIVYISLSVLIVGILFNLLGLHGSKNMLMIGLISGGIATALLGIFSFTVKSSGEITTTLFRALPVLLVSAYFLLM